MNEWESVFSVSPLGWTGRKREGLVAIREGGLAVQARHERMASNIEMATS